MTRRKKPGSGRERITSSLKSIFSLRPSVDAKEEVFEPSAAEWFTDITKIIAPARQKKYLTQRQLAAFLHTSQAVISRLETGKANPTVEFLVRLFKVLGIEVEVRIKY